MQRLKLTRTISIPGHTWWGKKSTVTLMPHPREGLDSWLFGPPTGGTPITINMFQVLPGLATSRTITLDDRGRRFHEFEHFGWLHALGLRGVCVYLEGSDWPPYMCAAELWDKVKDWLVPDGALKPFYPSRKDGNWVKSSTHPVEREIRYIPAPGGLRINAGVSYRQLMSGGRATLFFPEEAELPLDTIQTIAASRSLGRPELLKPVTRVAGFFDWWPHTKKLMWLSEAGNGRIEHNKFCEELARHQILDAMVPLSVIAPPGHFFSGRVMLDRCNHALVLYFAKEIAEKSRVDISV